MKINMNHFSDLHYNSVTSFDEMERLLDKLLEANPDYLMFTGDLLDSNDEQYNVRMADYLRCWLDRLSTDTPLFMIRGNHDIYTRNYMENSGDYYNDPTFWNEVSEMDNVHCFPEEKFFIDDNIYVLGVDLDSSFYKTVMNKRGEYLLKYLKEYEDLFCNLPSNKLKVFMSHPSRVLFDPKVLETICEFDITMSGHEHNGLVPNFIDRTVPGHRGLIGTSKDIFPNNVRGFKRIEGFDHTIYSSISGGINKIPTEVKLNFLRFLYRGEFNSISYDTESQKVKVKKMYN